MTTEVEFFETNVEIYETIRNSIKGTEYKFVPLSEIDPTLTVDIRIDRSKSPASAEVMESLKKGFFAEVSPLILMAGRKKTIIDGLTRFFELYDINPNGYVYALVVPELTKEHQIILNLVLNSKRSNLSDRARQVAVEYLRREQNKSIEETSKILGFSKRDVQVHDMIADFPKEIRETLDTRVSYRKIEEGIGNIYRQNPEIPNDFLNAVAITQSNRIFDLNINRDSMSVAKVNKTLDKNIKIGFKNGLTPAQIVNATLPVIEKTFANGEVKEVQVIGGSDLICEHPQKLDAVEEYIDKLNPEWFINLFCESKLFDSKDDTPVITAIERASTKIGKENCTAISNFEGVKLGYIKEYGVNYHQGDVYDWLTHQTVKVGKGLIFVDSYGSSNYNSISFINYLKRLYPEATILFLILDQFKDYRNSGSSRLSQYFIMNWGINPVDTVDKLANHFNFEIVWTDSVDSDGNTKERGLFLLKA